MVFEGFTDPFRYVPHPLVRKAAGIAMERVAALEGRLREAFDEGKMMGVLVVRVPSGLEGFTDWLDEKERIGFLCAFSGAVAGRGVVEGFVPPIFDLCIPGGHYRLTEEKITALNSRIAALERSQELAGLMEILDREERSRDEEIGLMRARMAVSKRERDEIRCELSDPSRLADLIRESQFEKAELHRLKTGWNERIAGTRRKIEELLSGIGSLKRRRAEMSDGLQRWIFGQYMVHNALGEASTIWDIFAERGLVPPGGTGDCAAPKLLERAFMTGMEPLAMGEYWYGRASDTAVRLHGHFYPSCTSKCGPLLEFMTRGLKITGTDPLRPPHIVFEDEWIAVVEKEAGVPSVPGLDGRESVLEWLNAPRRRTVSEASVVYESVHRLDMDTSGVMVFAKNPQAGACLRKQFEEHTVTKVYAARLCPPGKDSGAPALKSGDRGRIELPLGPDYDERPRQKVDMSQNRGALTGYEVVNVSPDGSTDILFRPVTGRTHQLRVHSAHKLGLRRPIIGDLLYGGYTTETPASSPAAGRLHLHALSITFLHPASGEPVTFTSEATHYVTR